jgi:2-methylisocitrate lyase-like PEP mutase family enzyme
VSMPTDTNPPRPSIADRRRTFHALHRAGCFLIPNPWDIGSAIYLQSLGFKALATTSSGFAWSQGVRDGAVTLDQALAHYQALVEATDVPINADFEGGFAADPAGVADHVRLAIEAGVSGLSIEDSTGNSAEPLYSPEVATERIRQARRAIDRAGGDTLLVGRAECFLVGRPNLAETIARLKAYAGAGADCLYAPGLPTREHIESVVAALAPKPVNVLVSSATTLSLGDFEAMGVRRISVGGALARAAWRGFIHAARLMAEKGRFDELPGAPAGTNLDAFFQQTRGADDSVP